MSARRRGERGAETPSAANLKQWRAFREMRERKPAPTLEAIGQPFGLSGAMVRKRLCLLERYEKGERILAKCPTSIEGLRRTGQFPDISGMFFYSYRVNTLRQLADFSRAELLGVRGIGPRNVDRLAEGLARFGLSLHPDRPRPKRRKTMTDILREERRAEDAAGWQDRDFLVEQCRRVKEHIAEAFSVLSCGVDDPEFRAALTAVLKATPPHINALGPHTRRLRRDANKAASRELAEIERRLAAGLPPFPREDEPTTPAPEPVEYGGNVVPFRRPAMRGKVQSAWTGDA